MGTYQEREAKLAEDYVKRVHVDQALVRKGEPAITVQTSSGPLKGAEAVIHGPSRVVHSPDKPLSCGARVWIETEAMVEIHWPTGGVKYTPRREYYNPTNLLLEAVINDA
jgi:hypothetical protein